MGFYFQPAPFGGFKRQIDAKRDNAYYTWVFYLRMRQGM